MRALAYLGRNVIVLDEEASVCAEGILVNVNPTTATLTLVDNDLTKHIIPISRRLEMCAA